MHSEIIAIFSISYVCSYTMGTMISFFRRPEMDTTAQLSAIEVQIKSSTETHELNGNKLANLNKNTWFYGGLVFAILLVFIYAVFPLELIRRIILLVLVFVLYPIGVLLTRKFFKYWLTRKKLDAEKSLEQLTKERDEILENVMEKEPYNKAREILKRFAPQQLDKQKSATDEKVRRHKLVNGIPANMTTKPVVSTPVQNDPNKTLATPGVQNIPVNVQKRMQLNATYSGHLLRSSPNRNVKTVRPLPNQLNQSKVDKIVGWVVGSNPEQMYALICQSCCKHNGLALREEFVYLDWKCAFCHHHNPARKERPRPPRLQEQKPMDKPRSLSSSRSPSADRHQESSGTKTLPVPDVAARRDSVDKKEDSGTESDQMEKHDESSVLEESIIRGAPDISSKADFDDEDETNDTIEQDVSTESATDVSVKRISSKDDISESSDEQHSEL